jgi:predicted ABC-type ATPase
MPRLSVLAGTNGAGKSSIAGAMLCSVGGQYYNPDEETKHVLTANPGIDPSTANGLAWQAGISQLRGAIDARQNYIFETTLGGNTITSLLLEAAAAGLEVWVWYCGLDGPDRHLSRIRSRVARGGHDIPEEKVRARYVASRRNLVRLMPHLSRLTVYDNSAEADPAAGQIPEPRLLLDVSAGAVIFPESQEDLRRTPAWAQPLVACAYDLAGR